MGPSRTKTVKNKHTATNTSSNGAKRSASDGISKPKPKPKPKGVGPSVSKQVKDRNPHDALKKKKKKTYSAEELGIPSLNMITPVGVVKPKGKKKGKVFVDDNESMTTILSMVQAEKKGQIESKMIKARQMEQIREARKAEMEKKETEKKSKMEDAKDSMRKKRKRRSTGDTDGVEEGAKEASSTGARSGKGRKRVSFA